MELQPGVFEEQPKRKGKSLALLQTERDFPLKLWVPLGLQRWRPNELPWLILSPSSLGQARFRGGCNNTQQHMRDTVANFTLGIRRYRPSKSHVRVVFHHKPFFVHTQRHQHTQHLVTILHRGEMQALWVTDLRDKINIIYICVVSSSGYESVHTYGRSSIPTSMI